MPCEKNVGKLIGYDRSKWDGFYGYWSRRKNHFEDLFHQDFSKQAAETAFKEVVVDGVFNQIKQELDKMQDGEWRDMFRRIRRR